MTTTRSRIQSQSQTSTNVLQLPEATCNSSIPSRSHSSHSTDWHTRFEILKFHSFSQHVWQAISTGVLTGKARKKITLVLRTYMTAFTLYPSSEQYTTVGG